jgi:acyl-CoA synthetase (AMP-forming)/AMP-acid ligase II
VRALDLLRDADGRSDSRALVSVPGDELTRRKLARLVDRTARELDSPGKSLVMCLGDRDLGTVTAYLAALRLGHAVAFLPATRTGPDGCPSDGLDLIRAYQPEFVVADPQQPLPVDAAGLRLLGYDAARCQDPPITVFRRRPGAPAGPILDDTALLLATSGSTGSPKTVRLGYRALLSNVDAIVAALGIGSGDVAISSLPIRYSYGLSVLNTHLRAGATVVLNTDNPSSLAFWDRVARAGVTSVAAVPATYRTLTARHLARISDSRVSVMTQAGGALPDDLVLRFWSLMNHRGGRFFVMYGQTEATARISCLHPDHLPGRVGSAGVAIPGGRVSIAPGPADAGAPAGRVEGEVCYSGPGVMLGYARGRADLSRPAEIHGPLKTGDLGYLDGGFLYLIGRLKRISKLFGQRVSLDDIERGLPAGMAAVADDRKIFLVTADPTRSYDLERRRIAHILGVTERVVAVVRVPELPLSANGKMDYAALQRLVTP